MLVGRTTVEHGTQRGADDGQCEAGVVDASFADADAVRPEAVVDRAHEVTRAIDGADGVAGVDHDERRRAVGPRVGRRRTNHGCAPSSSAAEAHGPEQSCSRPARTESRVGDESLGSRSAFDDGEVCMVGPGKGGHLGFSASCCSCDPGRTAEVTPNWLMVSTVSTLHRSGGQSAVLSHLAGDPLLPRLSVPEATRARRSPHLDDSFRPRRRPHPGSPALLRGSFPGR